MLHHMLRALPKKFDYIGVATSSGSSSASVTPHASTQAGDLLVAVWHFKDADTTNSITWPSGFTQKTVINVAQGSGYSYIGLAYKTSDGADGAQSFSWTGYSAAGVSILTFRNAKSGDPFDVVGAINASAVASSVTITKAGSCLVGLANGFGLSSNITPPGSMTEIYEANAGATGGLGVEAAVETGVASGSTGTRTFTSTYSTTSSVLFAIAPK